MQREAINPGTAVHKNELSISVLSGRTTCPARRLAFGAAAEEKPELPKLIEDPPESLHGAWPEPEEPTMKRLVD